MQIPTPLVIVKKRHGDTVTETGRFRGTPSTFFAELILQLATASVTDPDETIIHILRPVAE